MYRTVADFTYDLEVWVGPAGDLLYISPSCSRVTGYEAADALRDPGFFGRIIAADDFPRWRQAMDARGDIPSMDFRIRRRDGTEIWLAQETTRVFDPGGRFQGWRLSLRDVTDRVRTRMSLDQARQHLEVRVRERTEELEVSRERYRALSGYLQHSIEKERGRISREIHDVLGQDLTALNMGLHRLERSFPQGDARQGQVAELRGLVAGTLETVRRISRELRPPMLDELGFAEAVIWLTRTFAQSSGLRIDLKAGLIPDLSAEQSTALYRVLQEALTNAARHSGATRIDVRVHVAAAALTLDVSDNGVGMPAGQPESSGSLGLLGMRERMRMVGGTLDIAAPKSGGTTISARIPLAGEPTPCAS
jgi:PAS domain S-box-containing protein